MANLFQILTLTLFTILALGCAGKPSKSGGGGGGGGPKVARNPPPERAGAGLNEQDKEALRTEIERALEAKLLEQNALGLDDRVGEVDDFRLNEGNFDAEAAPFLGQEGGDLSSFGGLGVGDVSNPAIGFGGIGSGGFESNPIPAAIPRGLAATPSIPLGVGAASSLPLGRGIGVRRTHGR